MSDFFTTPPFEYLELKSASTKKIFVLTFSKIDEDENFIYDVTCKDNDETIPELKIKIIRDIIFEYELNYNDILIFRNTDFMKCIKFLIHNYNSIKRRDDFSIKPETINKHTMYL